MDRFKKALITNDWHIQYHDERVIDTIIYPLIEDHKFDTVIVAGDFLDCYAISDFDKDPARITSFQDELDTGIGILGQIGRLVPKAHKVFLEGNHEARLEKELRKHQSMHCLRNLQWAKLLEFERNGFISAEGLCRLNNVFVVGHGTLVRKHSGYSAKGEYDKYGISGMTAHTHRMGQHSHTNMSGVYGWWENGHLSDMRKTEYVQRKLGGLANWQQGFSIIYYSTNRYHVDMVHITDGQCIVNGKLYGRKK